LVLSHGAAADAIDLQLIARLYISDPMLSTSVTGVS